MQSGVEMADQAGGSKEWIGRGFALVEAGVR